MKTVMYRGGSGYERHTAVKMVEYRGGSIKWMEFLD